MLPYMCLPVSFSLGALGWTVIVVFLAVLAICFIRHKCVVVLKVNLLLSIVEPSGIIIPPVRSI